MQICKIIPGNFAVSVEQGNNMALKQWTMLQLSHAKITIPPLVEGFTECRFSDKIVNSRSTSTKQQRNPPMGRCIRS